MPRLTILITVAVVLMVAGASAARSTAIGSDPLSGRILPGEPVLQRYLGISDSQRAAMGKLKDENQLETYHITRELTDPDEVRKRIAAIQERLNRSVLALPTSRQQQQLKKIQPYSGLGYGVAGALIAVEGLTPEQRTRLAALADETVVKRVNLFYDFKLNGGGSPAKSDAGNPEYARQLRTLEDEAAAGVVALLAPAQAKAFSASRRRQRRPKAGAAVRPASDAFEALQ